MLLSVTQCHRGTAIQYPNAASADISISGGTARQALSLSLTGHIQPATQYGITDDLQSAGGARVRLMIT